MACLICGKSLVPEETIKHINNIEVKKEKIDEKIDSIFTSDINRAVELIIKSKKYAKEIKHLSTGSYSSKKLLCDECCSKIMQFVNNKNQKQINETGYSEAKEILKALKIFTYLANKSFFELKHDLDELREILCGLYMNTRQDDVDEIINEKNKIVNKLNTEFEETLELIQKSVDSPEFIEYYEAKLFYILGYYNETVLYFFDNKKRLVETDILKYEANIMGYYKEALLHYQNVKIQLLEMDDKERKKVSFDVKLWINNINEMVFEINEKLERNKGN